MKRCELITTASVLLCALSCTACGAEVQPNDSGLDAGMVIPCDTPGATESVACGRCGTTTRFCTVERVWSFAPCTGEEGECAPGEFRSGPCGSCGTQPQRCTTSCTWEGAAVCSGEGTCEAGSAVRTAGGCPSGQTREAQCTDACMIDGSGSCEDNSCPTPGATESVACGRCGTAQRYCDASREWQYDACMNEGECAPGTMASVACGNCGTATARCDAACAWYATGSCSGEGECAPGTTTMSAAGCSSGEERVRTCNEACAYGDGPCIGGTPDAGPPRIDAGRADAGVCSESPCRLIAPQCGCAPGQACQFVSGSRRCGTPGSSGEGAACSTGADCAAGMVCAGGVCSRSCDTDADCPGRGSYCVYTLSGAEVRTCSIPCEPATSAGCRSGYACRWHDGGGFYYTDCAPAGSARVGEACVRSDDCVANATCVNHFIGDSSCERVCRLDEGPDCAYCNAFVDVTPTIDGTEYGFCG